MDPEARARVESLCLEALSRDARGRSAFLDEACGGDAELRREIESLLVGPHICTLYDIRLRLIQRNGDLSTAPGLTIA